MKNQLFLFLIIFSSTISLKAQFAQQWLNTFDATYHDDDNGMVITLDVAGNVIVSGQTYSAGQLTSEIMTIKYDPSGNVLWQMPYMNGNYVYPLDVITDANRNIYIVINVFINTDLKIRVLKYSCAGVLLWDALYPTTEVLNYANRISLDSSGNVYVGGASHCDLCYSNVALPTEALIIKFDSLGNYIAEMRTGQFFPGLMPSGNYTDLLTDMEISESSKIYSITNLTQDSSLLISVGSGQIDDFGLSKHDTIGTRQFLKRIPRSSKNDIPSDLFIGNNEDVFISGFTKDTISGSKESYLTAKLDSSGNVLYLVERGNAAWKSVGVGVVADMVGYAYVTGFTFENDTTPDIELIKYDSIGNEVWVQTYNSIFNNWDEPSALHIDADANLYISARSHNGSNYDWLILKYDSVGNFQWEQRYNAPSNQEELGPAIVLNTAGEVFATGSSQGSNGHDFLTVKYGFPTTITGDSLCATVGINELQSDVLSFSAYPNPVSTILIINCLENINEVRIYDVLGKDVYNTAKLNSASELKIPTGNFSSGIYFVTFKTNNSTFNQKIIKN